MPGPEYRVLLRGLKDQSESGRRLFLQRFGEAYKMSPEQAAQWLRTRKGVVYAVKTPEAAEKARRYIESLGGVVEVEKAGAGPADGRTEPARLELDRELSTPATSPAPPAAAAPDTPSVPEVPVDDAFVSDAAAPAVTPSASGAPLRACPHCGYPYPQNQAACPACRRPAVDSGPAAGAGSGGPGRPAFSTAAPGYDLSAIVNITIETYKNNFVTLYGLSALPVVMVSLITFGAVSVGLGGAALGKDYIIPMVAGAVGLGIILLPLVLYALTYFWAALIAAIDVSIRGARPDLVGILKAVPPMMPVQLMANGLFAMLVMGAALTPFLAVTILAATQKMAGLAVVAALPIIPIAAAASLLFMFVMPVTVLEGLWAMDALKRSATLGRGYYLRNFGVMFLITLSVGVVISIASIPIQMIPVLGTLLTPLVQALATPATTIPIILLYYDMRLKKG